MPSSWTSSLRFNKQFNGENINLWGDVLNDQVFTPADYAIAGWLDKALTGDVTLTTVNGAADEARVAMIKFTGTGAFVVTIPPVSKSYKIWNACTGVVTITTGAGATVLVDPGDVVLVICDGSAVKTLGYGGLTIKEFISASVLAATGSLPAATGNEGKALVVYSGAWTPRTLTTSNLSDYAADRIAILRRARVYAIAL